MNTTERIVQAQLDAYNNRDIQAFSACYSKDIAILNFQETTPFLQGIEQLEAVYAEVFRESPLLEATIKNRIVFDNKVIDEEHVTGRKGVDYIKVVVIYEVNDGLINKVTFIRS